MPRIWHCAAVGILTLCGCNAPLEPAEGPQRVVLLPAATSRIEIGQEQQYSAVVLHGDGRELPEHARWSSSDTSVLEVDAGGKARALAIGTATLSARVGALTASRSVSVTGRLLDTWEGEFLVRRCHATGSFATDARGWDCRGYPAGSRHAITVILRRESDRLDGVIRLFAHDLRIDGAGSRLLDDGRLFVRAGGAAAADAVEGTVEPFHGLLRDSAIAGTFTYTVTGRPGAGSSGERIIEGELTSLLRLSSDRD